jgi:hypothetical protein
MAKKHVVAFRVLRDANGKYHVNIMTVRDLKRYLSGHLRGSASYDLKHRDEKEIEVGLAKRMPVRKKAYNLEKYRLVIRDEDSDTYETDYGHEVHDAFVQNIATKRLQLIDYAGPTGYYEHPERFYLWVEIPKYSFHSGEHWTPGAALAAFAAKIQAVKVSDLVE